MYHSELTTLSSMCHFLVVYGVTTLTSFSMRDDFGTSFSAILEDTRLRKTQLFGNGNY